MADEPRRSGRATKGQHTKNDELDSATGKKGKGGRKKAQKDESEEPGDIIRCVCGYTIEDKKDKRAMVCCDGCQAWQHNVHMGLSEDEDDLPEQYFCEQCRPEDHKELLDALGRGEPIWEVREQEARMQKNVSRKKGKGGRKIAAPAEKETVPNSTDPSSVVSPASQSETKQEVGQKRKLPAEPLVGSPGNLDQSGNKMRKVTVHKDPKSPARRQSTQIDAGKRVLQPQSTPLQMTLTEKIEEILDDRRRNAARALEKLFSDCAKAALEAGASKVPAGQELPVFATQLALNVEYAMFVQLWGHDASPKPEYGMQLRQILHNVKANTELRDQLLNGQLSPQRLSVMSSTDMASKELREKTAEMKKKVEEQSILIQETAPLIRRTHKGEELVERAGQEYDGAHEQTFRAPRRINTDGEPVESDEAGSPKSPGTVELPSEINRRKPPVDIRKLSIDTKRRSTSGPGSARRSSTNFDVDRVWSSVESPGTPARPTPTQGNRPRGAFNSNTANTKADPEIDRLLKDENEDEDEYEPADFTPDPDIIWGGAVQMAMTSEFRATAKYVAGADLSQAYPWDQLMPPLLTIEGRIDAESANTYLCGLQWSRTNDVSVVALSPADHQEDRNAFNKLFDYLSGRNRYGVIRASPIKHATNIYVIPLEAGIGGLPEFIELLIENNLESPRKSRVLLVVYVIKCTPKLESTEGPQATPPTASQPAPVQSPIAPSSQQHRTPSVPHHMSPVSAAPLQHSQHQSIPPNPYAASPPAGHSFIPPPTPQHVPSYPQAYAQPPNSQQSTNGGGGGLNGMAAAIHILGDMANSPSIIELLNQKPGVGVNEFSHIKDVFLAAPETRGNFGAMMEKLAQKLNMRV